jgi:hypothetical protein
MKQKVVFEKIEGEPNTVSVFEIDEREHVLGDLIDTIPFKQISKSYTLVGEVANGEIKFFDDYVEGQEKEVDWKDYMGLDQDDDWEDDCEEE